MGMYQTQKLVKCYLFLISNNNVIWNIMELKQSNRQKLKVTSIEGPAISITEQFFCLKNASSITRNLQIRPNNE